MGPHSKLLAPGEEGEKRETENQTQSLGGEKERKLKPQINDGIIWQRRRISKKGRTLIYRPRNKDLWASFFSLSPDIFIARENKKSGVVKNMFLKPLVSAVIIGGGAQYL